LSKLFIIYKLSNKLQNRFFLCVFTIFLRVVIGLHSGDFMAFQMFPQALVGRS